MRPILVAALLTTAVAVVVLFSVLLPLRLSTPSSNNLLANPAPPSPTATPSATPSASASASASSSVLALHSLAPLPSASASASPPPLHHVVLVVRPSPSVTGPTPWVTLQPSPWGLLGDLLPTPDAAYDVTVEPSVPADALPFASPHVTVIPSAEVLPSVGAGDVYVVDASARPEDSPLFDMLDFTPLPLQVSPVGQDGDLDHTLGYDHVAHAVPGRDYTVFDLDGDGVEEVPLDGSRSHSHFYDADAGVLAEIVSWVWFDPATGVELAAVSTPFLLFSLGVTAVGLRVVDSAGNTHEEVTRVEVLGSRRGGVYCYYYDAVGDGTGLDVDWNEVLGRKPVYGEELQGVTFESVAQFPPRFGGGGFQVRCTFSVEHDGGEQRFEVHHRGVMQMLVDVPGGHHVVMENFGAGVQTTSTVYDLPQGLHFLQILYAVPAGKPALLSLTDAPAVLLHDLARQLPLIYDISPQNSTLGAGGRLSLNGTGFWNDPNVYFNEGEVILAPDTALSTEVLLVVEVPPADEAKVVEVSVGNRIGGSNSLPFRYSADALEPVRFEETKLMGQDGAPYQIKLITNLQFGPDHRLYLASLDSFVYSLGVGRNLRVTDECKSESLGSDRTVIGLAFNPADLGVTLYASSSIFFWENRNVALQPPWANGQISMLRPGHGGHCLGVVGAPIISGLPVSNHDHGVNNLLFDDDGILHFQVGAATNAGVQAVTIGGLDESPLSAASLVADIFAPQFNGTVEYDSADPGTARQIAGDVHVFAPGWRNSFDLVLHSNGFIYATDNGANAEFGNRSTSCDGGEQLISPYDTDDKIGKVMEGVYAGHANRNRGRDDERECVWRGPFESAGDGYVPPMALVESSTDGIMEYTADLWGGQMKGDLLASKFSTNDENDNGRVYRMRVDGEGNKEGEVETLWEGSGLSIQMGAGGEILMPRLYEESVMVLRPLYEKTRDGRLIAVSPFRGPVAGGNEVRVRVDGGGLGATALFDGQECVSVRRRREDEFLCVVPPGTPGSVEVAIRQEDGSVVQSSGGADYRYMRV